MFQPAPRRHRRLPTGTMVSYAEVKSYLSKREIPQLFESLMAGLMYHRPENHIGYLQSCLDEVRANETKVQWSTFVNAKKRKSKEILPPLTPKKQDSFSSWSDNSRQSTPLPPISARTRTRTSMEQQDLRNTYILYHNPPPILAKPKVPVISVLGGLGSKIDELCERVVGRLRGVVHISTCSMLKTRMTIEGFYRVTSVPACAVVDSVLQAMSMVQSANALIVAGFPRNRGDIEEYRSRRVRMDGVVLVDFEEEALRSFLEHEVASGAIRTSEIEAELERFKQDIISVAEYYDEKDLLTVVMGDQDMEEIIDDLVLAVDKVIETRKNIVDEDSMDIKKDGECDSPHNAIAPSPDRMERPSTVEIRDATEEDIKSIEAEANKTRAIEGADIDELSKEKADSTDNASKVSEDDGTNVKAESEIEASTAKLEEDASNKSEITDKMEVSEKETTDVKEEISEGEAAVENSEEVAAAENSEAEATAEKGEEAAVEKSEEAEAEKSEEADAEKSEEADAEKSEAANAEKSEEANAEKSEANAEKSEANAEKSEEAAVEKSEEADAEKSEEADAEKSEEAAVEKSEEANAEKSEEAEAEKEEAAAEGNEVTVEDGEVVAEKSEDVAVEKSEGEKEAEESEEGKEAEKSESEQPEKSEEQGLESAEGQKDPSDIELNDDKELHSKNTDDKENEKSETNENEASENGGDPTDDKQASEKNVEEQLRVITPNIPLVFAFENINVDYDEIRNLIANDLEMCFIDFHELMRNDGSNDDKFDNDEALSMLRGILKQDSVSYSNGFFIFKFPFSLLSENNVEELLKLGNVSFVCKVRENKSDSESETKEVKEEKLFHSSLSERVKIIFVTENNIIDELRQALQEMVDNKNISKEDVDAADETKENADQSEKSISIENKQEDDNVEEKVPDTNENDDELAEVAEQEKEDKSGQNDENEEEEKSSKNEKDGDEDTDIQEKEDVMTEDKTNQDNYEDSTGKDIEDLISDDTLNEGSKPPESLKSEENQDLIPDEGEVDHTHSQASTLDDETQKERAVLERQSGMEMDDASINDEDNNKPKLARQSTYSAGEETNDEEKEDKVDETSEKDELSKEESNVLPETKDEDELQEPKEDENISELVTENKEAENASEVENENDSNKNEETGDDIVEAKEVERAELNENNEETQPEVEKIEPEEQQSEISENQENKQTEAEENEGQNKNEAEEVEAEIETNNEENESPGDGKAESEDAENETSKQENSESAKEVEVNGNEETKSDEKEPEDKDNGSTKDDSENTEVGETGSENENAKENETENLRINNKMEPTEDSAKNITENEENENADDCNAEEAEQSEQDKSETPINENSENKEESEAANPENDAVNDNEDEIQQDDEASAIKRAESKNEDQNSNEEIAKTESISQEKDAEEKEISEKSDKGTNNEEEKATSPDLAKQKVVDNDSDSNDENVIIETQAEVHATDCASPPTAEAERSDSKNGGNQDDEIQKSDAENAENEKTDQNVDDDSSNKNKQNENESLHKETILQNESDALTIQNMENMGSERYSGKRQERNGSGILDESREQDPRESEEPQERSSSSSRGEL